MGMKEIYKSKDDIIKYPNGYTINRIIFRACFWILFLVIGFIAYSDGLIKFDFEQKIYFECYNVNGCINPFYHTDNPRDSYLNEYVADEKLIKKCVWDWCKEQRLNYGSYGQKPSTLFKKLPGLAVGLFVLCMLLNHLAYNRGFKWKKNNENIQD